APGAEQLADLDLEPELFAHLAHERRARILAVLDLAARELPLAGQPHRRPALRGEAAPVAHDRRADDVDLANPRSMWDHSDPSADFPNFLKIPRSFVMPQFIYTMKNLRKVTPQGKEILRGIWLSFYHGAKIGVLGANGAGKSTLLRIMAGVDKDFDGETILGEGYTVG